MVQVTEASIDTGWIWAKSSGQSFSFVLLKLVGRVGHLHDRGSQRVHRRPENRNQPRFRPPDSAQGRVVEGRRHAVGLVGLSRRGLGWGRRLVPASAGLAAAAKPDDSGFRPGIAPDRISLDFRNDRGEVEVGRPSRLLDYGLGSLAVLKAVAEVNDQTCNNDKSD